MIFTPEQWQAALPVDRVFGRQAPLELDLGCGKGRFLRARATAHPTHDFIGTDVQFGRLAKVRRQAERLHLPNIRLLHAETAYTLQYLIPPASVSAAYLFFPDPWPKRKHHRRRLVSASFLDLLARILRPEAPFHVATDHEDYAAWIRAAFTADSRFAPVAPYIPDEAEQTDFERLFLGHLKPIHRLSFHLHHGPVRSDE